MISARQRQAWFLDAAATYCNAVRGLADALASGPVRSRGLQAFGDYLSSYAASSRFGTLTADTAECRSQLARITYLVRIRGPRAEVSRYDGEPDYSAEIAETFERFLQGAVKDYRVSYRGWPPITYVGAQILNLAACLFPAEFTALAGFCGQHGDFLDPTVRQFERELQFYLSYLDYIAPLRAVGLPFAVLHLAHRYGDEGRERDIRELLGRLATGRFRLAVAGQFSRGKTTLMNVLLGDSFLPIGALPVTSVVTTVRYGTRARALIRSRSGGLPVEVPVAEAARFIAQSSADRTRQPASGGRGRATAAETR